MAKTPSVTVAAVVAEHKSTRQKDALKLSVDFSGDEFLTLAAESKKRIMVRLDVRDKTTGVEPLPLTGCVSSCQIKLDGVRVPDDRLADLRFLCQDSVPVKLTLEAPTQTATLTAAPKTGTDK